MELSPFVLAPPLDKSGSATNTYSCKDFCLHVNCQAVLALDGNEVRSYLYLTRKVYFSVMWSQWNKVWLLLFEQHSYYNVWVYNLSRDPVLEANI